MSKIFCKNCDNPLGEFKDKTLTIYHKRISDIEHNYEENKSSVKCRKCSYYSNLSVDVNELDEKRTALNLLR